MERIFKMSPAFDKRHTEPSKNYGIHSATLFMCVKNEQGAVIFSMSTEWFLPETNDWLRQCENRHTTFDRKWQPRGNAVCYCSPKPMNEWQEKESGRDNCDWLGCCWGDCSYSTSDAVVELLISKGSDAVWEYLENWHKDVFSPKVSEQVEA